MIPLHFTQATLIYLHEMKSKSIHSHLTESAFNKCGLDHFISEPVSMNARGIRCPTRRQ